MLDIDSPEISVAAKYLSSFLDKHQIESIDFLSKLKQLLVLKNRDHWFPGFQYQGNGYRAINNDSARGEIDNIVRLALYECKLPCDPAYISRVFDIDFVLWIDPGCVSVRFGGDRSRIDNLYVFPDGQQEKPVNNTSNTGGYISDVITKALSYSDHDRAQYNATPPLFGFDIEDRSSELKQDLIYPDKIQDNQPLSVSTSRPAQDEFRRKVLERLQKSEF